MEAVTGKDPITGFKWTRRNTAKIAAELKAFGIDLNQKTVGRWLKQLGFSLRANQKKVARSVNALSTGARRPFLNIAELREQCAAEHVRVISIDTKKKELIGNFRHGGQAWIRNPVAVNDHDFCSEAMVLQFPSESTT